MTVNGAARWRGASWSALGTGPGAPLGVGTVALAAFDPGTGPRLYAGGSFTRGGVLTGAMGQWDGTSWTTLGGLTTTSINSPSVSALAVHDDGSGPRLFAGRRLRRGRRHPFLRHRRLGRSLVGRRGRDVGPDAG